jgi:ribosomal protein L28
MARMIANVRVKEIRVARRNSRQTSASVDLPHLLIRGQKNLAAQVLSSLTLRVPTKCLKEADDRKQVRRVGTSVRCHPGRKTKRRQVTALQSLRCSIQFYVGAQAFLFERGT